MLYLDYAKSVANGYILNFFADSEEDITEVSNGKHFITKNGTDYGVPQPSSTVVITMSDKTKKTYVLNEAGEWQEGGVEMDYSKLTNAPITLANLADKNFIPEVNTYYEHLGETTEDFVKGIIYLYNGAEYKAIDGSGSGAGVRPDYDQNDPTQPDYIKNRPFYESLDYTIERNNAVYEQIANFNNLYVTLLFDSEEDITQIPFKDTIKVNWNERTYNCTAQYSDGVALFGNASLFKSSATDTGEPFCVLAQSDGSTLMTLYSLVVKTQQDEQSSFSIVVEDVNYVKKIGTKFLPSVKEMIAEEEEAGTFSVPKPSNSTDLVDKNYVDNFVVANSPNVTGAEKLGALSVNGRNYTLPQIYLHDVSYSDEAQELHFSFYTMNSQRAKFLTNFIKEGVSLTCPGYIIFKSANLQGFEANTYQILRITRGSDNFSTQVKVTVFKENGLKDYILPGAATLSDNVYSFPNYLYLD